MNVLTYTVTWGNWLFALVVVVILYFVLRIVAGALNRINLSGRVHRMIVDTLTVVLKLYEPLAIVLLLVIFVFINPYIHGGLVGVLLITAYGPIKNYLSGRVFLLAHQLKEGQRINIGEEDGLIRKTGRLGLSVQTQEGIRFINYATLLAYGYTLLRGEKIGRFHRLIVQPKPDQEDHDEDSLNDRLFTCPYIDWSIKPEIHLDPADEHRYMVQVLVREDQHLTYLVQLIEEWGYNCRLSDLRP